MPPNSIGIVSNDPLPVRFHKWAREGGTEKTARARAYRRAAELSSGNLFPSSILTPFLSYVNVIQICSHHVHTRPPIAVQQSSVREI